MSDGSISQDEIDALLSGISGVAPTTTKSNIDEVSDFKKTAFDKFLANPVSIFETNLSSMTKDETKVNSISFFEIDRESFMQKAPELVVATTCDFSAGLQGDHIFVMPHNMVSKIVGLINNEEKADIDDMALSITSEIVGHFLSAEISEFDNIGIKNVEHNPPDSMNIPKAMIRLPQKNFLCVEYDTKVDGGNFVFWEILTNDVSNKIAETINGGPDPNSTTISSPQQAKQPVNTQATNQQTQDHFQGEFNMANEEQINAGFQSQNIQSAGTNPTVQPAAFSPLQNVNMNNANGNIGLILDVFMELTVELGRTKKTVKEILNMSEGGIITLEKLAGESVDILVNHKPIAKGEVVVIDENFGVRVTEILSPSDRVNSLTK